MNRLDRAISESVGPYSGLFQRLIAVTLGIYFCLAALSDIGGVVTLVPGVAPHGISPAGRLTVGYFVLACAVGLIVPKISRFSAIALMALWVGRTVWDMTGGQKVSQVWGLLFGLLVLVVALGRNQPDKDPSPE